MFNLDDKNTLHKYYVLSALLFTSVFTSTYIILAIENYNLGGLLNFPSNTGLGSLKNQHDNTMIFSWARRAAENFSIFELGSNLSGVEKHYHHFSSRGFGLFLSGFFINMFDEPINAIFLIYFICGFINFYLILIYFKKFDFIISLFLCCLAIMFGSKAFGGVLNPFHYYEYFLREFENIKIYNSLEHSIYTALYRTPNILINNIFIFLSFYSIKKFNCKLYNSKTLFLIFLISISTVIDPLIFMVISLFFFLKISLNFLKKNLRIKNYIFFCSFLLLISSSLIFHYQNSLIAFGDNQRHGAGLPGFWTGNYLYSFEMLIFPMILFFLLTKKVKNECIDELLLIISLLAIYLTLMQINEIAASRITNRNFEIIIACISYLFLFKFLKDLDKKKIIIISLLLVFHFPYIYLLAGKVLFFKYIIFFAVILTLIISFYFLKKFINKKKIFTFCSILFVLIFFVSIFLKNTSHTYKSDNDEIMQKAFFKWISKTQKEKNLISLNFGILLNAELHTNQSVFLSNITNVPSHIDRSFLMQRLNNIFYLYGFTIEDLNKFLKDYITEWELKIDNFNPHRKNLAILNKIVFYENFQNDYEKSKPIKLLVDSYKEYLLDDLERLENFDTCIVTNYDEKFIKENSFFSEIKKEEPIYVNEFLKVYNCNEFKFKISKTKNNFFLK